jgi:Pel9A-like, right handed beta helix region
VGPGGSDGNPGTYAQPFATIQHAADVVSAGQSVGVEDGTYTRAAASSHCSSATTQVVCLWRGGTASAHVRFFAEHRWRASVDGQHVTDNGFTWGSGANYVDVDGFDVHALVSDGGSSSAFELYSAGQGSTISNCHAHDIGRQTTNTSNGLVGVFIAQNNVTVAGCYMHDIGRLNPAQQDHGVYLNQGNNVTITGNYFDTFDTGWGVQIYPSAETGTLITNNTFIGGKPDTSYTHLILGANLTTGTFTNNTFWSDNPSATMSDYQGQFTDVTFSNNTTTGSRWCDATTCTTNGTLPPGFTGTTNTLNSHMPKPPPPQ